MPDSEAERVGKGKHLLPVSLTYGTITSTHFHRDALIVT